MRTLPRILVELFVPSAIGGFLFTCLTAVGAHTLAEFLTGAAAAIYLAMRACIVQSICCTILIEIAYRIGLKPGSSWSVLVYVILGMLSGAWVVLRSEPGDWTTTLVLGAIGGVAGLGVAMVIRYWQRRADAKAA
jgi:hypothetical protein